MFLTRMALDVNRAETARLLEDRAAMGCVVASAFAYGAKTALWRIDELSYRTWLVILSQIRPDLEAIHQRYGYLGVFPSWDTIDYDDQLDDIHDGTAWRFELCAAPVGLAPNRRAEWAAEEYLDAWLRQQGESRGFRVQAARCLGAEWHPVGEKQLLLARWSGRLVVTEEELFLWANTTGIGGARELGAGLMTISGRGNVWGI